MLVLAFLASSTLCPAADDGFRVSSQFIVPGDSESWDDAVGLEAQYIVWATPNLGLALAAGIGSWRVTDDVLVGYDPDVDVAAVVSADGSALTLPFGGSVLFRPAMDGPAKVTLEAGLRYVFVDSGVDIEAAVYDGSDTVYITDNVDFDDGVIGLIGADISFPISPKVDFGFGAGYQVDIVKGDVYWMGERIGENEMKGIFIRLGFDVKI